MNEFLPDCDLFMTALQDEGQRDTSTPAMTLHFPKLEKFCLSVAKQWRKKNFPGMPKNTTDAKRAISSFLVKRRKYVDKAVVIPSFHKYADKDSKVFVLEATEPICGGFGKMIPLLQNFWNSNAEKAQVRRTPADLPLLIFRSPTNVVVVEKTTKQQV